MLRSPENGELAADNQDGHPARQRAPLHQGDERGGNQQLVGDGVEQRPDGRDLLPPARQVAVQQVGSGRRQKDGQRDPFLSEWEPGQMEAEIVVLDERRHQQGHEEDAKNGQRVRKIHRPPQL